MTQNIADTDQPETPLPTSPDQLLALLDRLGLAYRRYHHPPVFTVEESRALCSDIDGTHIKNLFVKNKQDQIWMITVRDDRRVDLNSLAKQIGAGRVSFARPELLFDYWGVRPGSVTPFGAINDADNVVSVVLDDALMTADIVNCHPLVNDQTVGIAPDDLLTFLRHTGHEPLIASIPERPAE
jgi:Ala-tRNA(Pro) deacylase